MNTIDRAFLESQPSLVTWKEELKDSWYRVDIRPYILEGVKESRWAFSNLEGKFSFRHFYTGDNPYVSDHGLMFVFELELDAMAFKLRWV